MIVERIKAELRKKNMTIRALEMETKIGNGVIRRWDASIPSADKLFAVASFLGVTVEYLLTGVNNLPPSYDNELFELYLSIPEEDQQRIKDYITFVSKCISIPKISPPQENMIKETATYAYKPQDIPILGYVAAGVPIHSENVPLGNIDIETGQKADYALIAKGRSMEPIIRDGDYIFVQKTSTLNIGEIGIFYIDEEVTCKKFYIHPDFIELKSLNPEFPPLKIPSNVSDFRIQGRVLLTQTQKERL